MTMPELTIVILTLNEESKLPRCLDSISEQYPVMVVDSGSSDNTVSIAKERGCKVVSHKWCGFADQRNFALRNCAIDTSWVLFIDADEIFSSQFYDWAHKAITMDDFDVAMIPSQLVFNGKPLRYAPGYQVSIIEIVME